MKIVKAVQTKDTPEGNLTWILLIVISTVLIMMIGFVTCCFFYLRSQKMQRMSALEVRERSRRRSQLDPSESSDNEANIHKKVRQQHANGITFGMPVGTPVVGQPIHDGLVDVDNLQASSDSMRGIDNNLLNTPTKVALMAGRNSGRDSNDSGNMPRDSSAVPLNHSANCISSFNNQINKENAADSVVEAEDVKLEFSEEEKKADGFEKAMFAAAQPQNYPSN